MNPIEIYSDGACSFNGSENAIGGWAYKIDLGGGWGITSYGSVVGTTNQKMEITAVIGALDKILCDLRNVEHIIVYSDSAYVVNCFNQKWIEKWKRNNWVGSNRQAVKNKELWEKLYELVQKFERVEFKKVKGHSGNENNELVDKLAVKAIEEHKNELHFNSTYT